METPAANRNAGPVFGGESFSSLAAEGVICGHIKYLDLVGDFLIWNGGEMLDFRGAAGGESEGEYRASCDQGGLSWES